MKLLRTCALMMPLWLLAACQSTPVGDGGVPTSSSAQPASAVSLERMSEITRVLASDAFQGRSMGTIGEERTIAYLSEQFRAAGLEPGGENGRGPRPCR